MRKRKNRKYKTPVLLKSPEFYALLLILSILSWAIMASDHPKNTIDYWKSMGVVVGGDVFVRPNLERATVVNLGEDSVYVLSSNGSSYKNEWIPENMIVPNLENR